MSNNIASWQAALAGREKEKRSHRGSSFLIALLLIFPPPTPIFVSHNINKGANFASDKIKPKSDMTTIIEPCCAERQLPALLREQKGRAVLFQTYGDVTFDNILKSVSSMAGNDHLTMTLCCREMTDRMKRTLQRYQQREWITTLHVLTDDLVGEVICIEGTLGTVIIQGPIQDTAAQRGTPVLYAGQFTKADGVVGDLPADRHPLAKLLDARVRRQSSLANGDGSSRDSKGPADCNATLSQREIAEKAEIEPLADSADDADTQGTVPAAAKGEADSTEGLSPKSKEKKSRTPKPKKL